MTETQKGAGGLLLALTLLNLLNFADRYLLIAFSTAIIPELGLSNLQFGLLTGVVFTGVYTVFGLFAGSLADRMHRPRLIAAGLALWSALTAATGLTRNFAQMAAARMLIGVGEACLTPAALSLLADRFAPARRAFASGVYYMGYPIGIGGSFIFAGMIGPTLGWRGGFIILGVIGIVAALLVFLFMRETRQRPAQAAAQGTFAGSFRALGAELRGNSGFRLTLIASTILVIALGGGILDLLWWVRERGFAATDAQKILGLVFLVGGALGALLGGVGADWAHKRGVGGRLRFLAWVFLVATPLVTLYRLVPGGSALFYGLALIGSMVTLMLFGPALTAVQEQVPAQHRASAVALFLLCSALIGAGGGNALAGWLADFYTASGYAEPLTLALLTMQAIALPSIPLFFLAARHQARRAALVGDGAAVAPAAG
jgi:MFS transporter, Spinster family, sphingosine-1-phosphate transporter